MNEMKQHETLDRILRGLATAIRFVEDMNSILSSVLISLALTIAVCDLITGGALLASLPWLVFVWAVAVAVGVEATLVSAFDRAHQAWVEMRRWQAAQWLCLGLLLATVGFVGVAAFTLQQSLHIGETAALTMMHLSPLAFDLGRSALTVLLACVAGVTRPRKQVVTHTDRKRELQEAIELEPLRQRLDALRNGKRAQPKKSIPQGPTFPSGGGTPLASNAVEPNSPERDKLSLVRLRDTEATERRPAAQLTPRERVFRLLQRNPALSKAQLAKLAHVSPSTAARWKSEYMAEIREAEGQLAK